MEILKFNFRRRYFSHYSYFTKIYEGFLKSIAILIGLVAGTILANVLGLVDVKAGEAHWLGIPQPFRFSGFGFDLGAILVFTIVAIVSLIESTGVYHALSEITGKSWKEKIFVKVTLRKVLLLY